MQMGRAPYGSVSRHQRALRMDGRAHRAFDQALLCQLVFPADLGIGVEEHCENHTSATLGPL